MNANCRDMAQAGRGSFISGGHESVRSTVWHESAHPLLEEDPVNSTRLQPLTWAAAGFAAACAMFFTRDLLAADPPPKPEVKTAFSEKLPNASGKTLTGLHVTYPPGGKSASHAHAGSVYAYVLSGKIRSENSVTGPVRVYSAGEGFFEPPGSVHTISENASDAEPASLLAIFVADDGAQLSRPAPK